MGARQNSNYYLCRLDKYWNQFGRLIQSSNRVLPGYLDAALTGNVMEETRSNFKSLLSELPFLGGEENPFTYNLVSSAATLSCIRVLETQSISVDTIGEIINKVYEDVFSSMARLARWFIRQHVFSGRRLRKLKAFAEESPSKRYPSNWVLEYDPGDLTEFDFGYNVTACSIQDSFRKMNTERYMPYMCATDHTASRVVGTGLYRTQTLSNGGDCCDFRYKKNRVALPGLPLEGLPEYQHRKH